MSTLRRPYDDWGRLVKAVLRRQHMLQLFHAQSRTPSMSSIDSDSSFSSDFDHQFVEISYNDPIRSDDMLESTQHVEEHILGDLLDDDNVITIGVYDVITLEKTVMAQKIEEIAKKQRVFDEIVTLNVGQGPDFEKLRNDLGIKNVLIILDDVSKSMNLEDLGLVQSWISEKGFKIAFVYAKTDVEIEVDGVKVFTRDIRLFSNVPKFRVKVGVKEKTIEDEKYMELSFQNYVFLENRIYALLKENVNLSLKGNPSNSLDFQELENIKNLKFCHCSTLSHIINSSNRGVFRFLESLYLENFTNLREICHGPLPVESLSSLRYLKIYEMRSLLHLWKNPVQNHTFINLKSIDIRNCKILPYLFTVSIIRAFVHLEELRILFCGAMKEVFVNDVNEENVSIHFPRLRKLVLHSLPSLVFFCKGIESLKLPQLHFLSIRSLPNLPGLVVEDSSLPVFISQTVEFGCLKELLLHGLDDNIRQIWPNKMLNTHFNKLEKLHIRTCNKLKYLFSPSIARALVSLNELHVNDSLMMTEVILNVEKETQKIIFPNLEKIEFTKLRSLRSFCQWKHDLKLPSLRHVSISMCPEMQTFTPGSLRTPKLEHFEIENEVAGEIKDLNDAIRKYFRTKRVQGASSSSTAGKRGKTKMIY